MIGETPMSAVKEWPLVMHAAYAAQERDRDSHTLAPVTLGGTLGLSERAQWEQEPCAACHSNASDPRGEFLAMVLHELRNPLSGIQLATEMLRYAEDRPPASDRLWVLLEKAIGQINGLTEDLLDLCRTTHPTFRLNTQPIDLAPMAHLVIERRRHEFERNGLWLAFKRGSKPVWIIADAERLELVLGNLLDNASKYTEPGGQVIVSVAVENHEAVLRVGDTGIGIAPEVLPSVFDPFVREGVAAGPKTQGSGIGLLLVRTLVELHGGRVEALSAGRGQGSTFVVRLPSISCATPKAATAQPVQQLDSST
jgi:signal transduction histidine kinase